MNKIKSYQEEAAQYEALYLARVSFQSKGLYRVLINENELLAEVSGKLRYQSLTYPAVGDYVMIDRSEDGSGHAIIHHILKRYSLLERRMSGAEQGSQLIAANIDQLFICMAMNNDFNLRRLERYLSIGWQSGAIPVIILTKADLCEDLQGYLEQVSDIALGVEIIMTSTVYGMGLDTISNQIKDNQTVAFVGSSGIGKSTLINYLTKANQMSTQETRSDDKGRHTTTARQMIKLENGGYVIDTPGMRELGVENGDLTQTFSDIEQLAHQCKFNDCHHLKEPGCAVREAIESGSLSEERFKSYRKLQKEINYQDLTHKQREVEKLNTMFAEVGGMKKARQFRQHKKLNR